MSTVSTVRVCCLAAIVSFLGCSRPVDTVSAESQCLGTAKDVRLFATVYGGCVHADATLLPEMEAVAVLESDSGRNTKHACASRDAGLGDFNCALGSVGLKASTGYDQYNRESIIRFCYPGLTKADFSKLLKTNEGFYNEVANAHWTWLVARYGGSTQKALFAWREGIGAVQKASPQDVQEHPYVAAAISLLGPQAGKLKVAARP